METLVKEYRIKSAEALGLKEAWNGEIRIGYYYGEILINDWQPDTNANQMLMLWEWMKINGREWVEILRDIFWEYGHTRNGDIKLITMKVFLEFKTI